MTVKAFLRWLMLEKAEESRNLWLRFLEAKDKVEFVRNSPKAENEIRQWAMKKDEY